MSGMRFSAANRTSPGGSDPFTTHEPRPLALAAVIATRRIFTRPVLEQWSSTRSQEGRRRGWVLDVVLVLVAQHGGF